MIMIDIELLKEWLLATILLQGDFVLLRVRNHVALFFNPGNPPDHSMHASIRWIHVSFADWRGVLVLLVFPLLDFETFSVVASYYIVL